MIWKKRKKKKTKKNNKEKIKKKNEGEDHEDNPLGDILGEIINHIRLPLIEVNDLINIVEPEQLISTERLLEVYKYHLAPMKSISGVRLRALPPIHDHPKETYLVFSNISSLEDKIESESFDLQHGIKWFVTIRKKGDYIAIYLKVHDGHKIKKPIPIGGVSLSVTNNYIFKKS